MQTGINTRWARRAAIAAWGVALPAMVAAAAHSQAAPTDQAPTAQAPAPDQTMTVAPPPAQVPVQAAVQAQELKPLDLWSAAGRDTGLPTDLWRGTSPELAHAALVPMAERVPSPAVVDLVRRMLATGAAAPEGAGSDQALAALRLRALIGLGDLEGAQAILDRTPAIETSEALSRAKAEVALLTGRDADACSAGRALQQGRDGAWWLKLRAYCSLVDNQPAAASVAMDLWRQGGGKAPAFDRLMTAAIAGTAPGKAALDEPLVFALSRRLNLDMAAAMPTAPVPETVALATDSRTPGALRLEAMARALRLGAAPVQAAREVYLAAAGLSATGASSPVAPPQVAPDLGKLAADPSAFAEAQLFALAAASSDLTLREGAISALLGRAHTNAEFVALSRLCAQPIAELMPARPALRDPALFAAAAAVAGDARTASLIRGGIEQSAAPGSDALDLALLDALIAVRSGQGATPVLDRLIERGGAGDAKSRARAQQGALILAATGTPMSVTALGELAGFELTPGKASPARLAALERAGSKKAQGATALLSVWVSEQPGGLTSPDRAAVVGALKHAGLDREASDLAAYGLAGLMGK